MTFKNLGMLAGETDVKCKHLEVLGDIFNPYDGGLRVSTFICLIGINI